jgi:hypothetical protein
MQVRDPLTGRLRSVRAHPFAFLAMGATIALVPWTLIYITQLPDRHTTQYWSEAWTGFDVLLACALGFTAFCALRERALLIVGLIVSSSLLVCDAWFDIVTSLGTDDQTITLLTALVVELPLAIYFALLTRRLLVASVRASRPEYAGTALLAVPLVTAKPSDADGDGGERSDRELDVII